MQKDTSFFAFFWHDFGTIWNYSRPLRGLFGVISVKDRPNAEATQMERGERRVFMLFFLEHALNVWYWLKMRRMSLSDLCGNLSVLSVKNQRNAEGAEVDAERARPWLAVIIRLYLKHLSFMPKSLFNTRDFGYSTKVAISLAVWPVPENVSRLVTEIYLSDLFCSSTLGGKTVRGKAFICSITR